MAKIDSIDFKGGLGGFRLHVVTTMKMEQASVDLRIGQVCASSRLFTDTEFAELTEMVLHESVGANSPSWMKDLQTEIANENNRRMTVHNQATSLETTVPVV
jgi:hypothetical protein